MIEYDTKLKELSEFVLELANIKEYLCFNFEEVLSLEIKEKMSISRTQSYNEVVQLALKAEKLTEERMFHSSF